MGPVILVTTEKNSQLLDDILKKYNWSSVYYFHHVLAAHDWYRGYQYDARLIPPQNRKLQKKFITFNRLTSSSRVYRSLLISELIDQNILDQGYVSYNDQCPEGGSFRDNLQYGVNKGWYTKDVAEHAIANINSIELPLRIDYRDQPFIPNQSFNLSAIVESQESFVYLVTETCYWENKCHLTEKIFKPIVSKMPFVLAGPAHNLEYLKSYGFKTFDKWWDEGYDTIEDPVDRMHAIGKVMKDICSRSLLELSNMLVEMKDVLEYNYQLFYSKELIDLVWNEMTVNIKAAVKETEDIVPDFIYFKDSDEQEDFIKMKENMGLNDQFRQQRNLLRQQRQSTE